MPINTTSLIIGTNLKFATVSTQAAPGDNLVSIYAKSDGKMYSRYGSSGEETIIGGNASLTIGTGLLSSSGSAYNSVSATTLSLTNTGVTAGTYSNATLVVDAQGRITSATASTSITGTSLAVSSADTQTEITIESTAAASRSTLKLLTNGNDWEIGARGSNLAPNNAFYIYDLTTGAYRTVIDSSGRMGIGTAAPNFGLHLQGNDSTALMIERTANDTTTTNTYTRGLYIRSGVSKSDWGIAGSTYSDATYTNKAWWTSTGKIALGAGGATPTHVVIDTNGNVGIGTSSPSQLLTVAGQVRISYSGSYTGMNISNKAASASVSGVSFIDFGNENEYGVTALWGEIRTDGGSSLGIHTTPAGLRTSDRKVERMRVDYNGNVGIGTTSPDTLLHVKSTTAWTQPIFESTLTTGGAAVLLKSDYTTWQLAARGSANDTAPGSFSIYDSTANAIRMFIDTSGQTGIRRIPSVPLDVEGWGRFVTPGTIGATNYGSTGGLIIRASAGSNDINYLQFVNNAGTSQYYHLLVKSDSRMYTSGPLSVDVGEVSVSSGVGDNFVLRTKTNTPNPNWTIGYGNGLGAVDTTKEYIFSNAGTISINSGSLSVTGSTTLGSYLGVGSSVGQTGGTRFTVHESSATSLATATMPNQKIRWTWYNDADGAIVGTRQYQLWAYPYSNQSASLAIFEAFMGFSIPTYTETALNVSSVVSGTRYVITSLGNTSQDQWRQMATGTTVGATTYAVNGWFVAAAAGPTGTTGTVISVSFTKQVIINAPTVLASSLTVGGITYIFPGTAPTAGQYLQSDASGNLTWATISTPVVANYARSFLVMGA